MLAPHGGCNCRCVMCDIWKANRDRRELTERELAPHIDAFREMKVRMVTLTGGEALMSPNIWAFCRLLRQLDVVISLMSTGLLLRRCAHDVVRWCDAVTVSIDGPGELHNAIRRVPRGFERMADGVAAIKALRPSLLVVGRCVVQRANYRALAEIVDTARRIGLDVISFLPADVSSEGFNRPSPWSQQRISEIALTSGETADLAQIIEDLIGRYEAELSNGFVHESAAALRRIPRYFAALNGDAAFPEVKCNAPWVSAVIEADLTVRPCYFLPAIGSIKEQSLSAVLNSERALMVRQGLSAEGHSVCRRCVCPLYIPSTASGQVR